MLRVENLAVNYGMINAVRGVNFEVNQGEIVSLIGANGAGKSTLMKILFGVQPPNSGTIEIDGHGEVAIGDPRHALALGIGLVSQEPSLVPQLDVCAKHLPGTN